MDQVTVITMELPFGQNGLWFPDLNVVGIAPHLDAAGRERALDEIQAQWRASLPIDAVATPDEVAA